ncbi:the designed hydrophobic core mutant of Ubiquitin, 1d7, partial [Linnemannia elongata AG-77]
VTIKKLSGTSVPMEVHSSMRVSEFKELFHRKEGIPVDQCRFIFAGKQLEDQLQLCEYNIQKDCVIHLVLRLRGG